MIWSMAMPQFGDMVRVKSGNIHHYGIFVNENEIIQFGLAPAARVGGRDSDVAVCSSDLAAFLHGGALEKAVFEDSDVKKPLPADVAVRKARARLGEKGYHILYNNCEHFAYECVLGEKKCTQTDDVRSMFHNMPIVDIYVAKIPETIEPKPIHPEIRWEEIENCKSEKVRKEKYCVWRLLQYAMHRSYGIHAQKQSFAKDANGKWTTQECFFSLSHCDDIVAVAVSRKPVGLDVEKITDRMDKIKHKILTEREFSQFEAQEDKLLFLTEKWTQKESIFKMQGGKSFAPNAIQAEDYITRTMSLKNFDGYILSVAAEEIKLVRTYQNIDVGNLL